MIESKSQNLAQITQQGQNWLIGGEVSFSNASELLEATNGFDNTQPTIIDFGQVTNADTSAISLILEWQRRATAAQSSVSYINLSLNLMSLASLYGVEDIIVHTNSN